MLHVLCRVGSDAYAIPCQAIDRVLPLAALKDLPGATHGLAGLLNYQGTVIPVVDLSLALTGQRSREVLGTRILLCPLAAAPSGKLGLMVEDATETAPLREEDFRPAGASAAPGLGDVASTGTQLVQRLHLPDILPSEVLAGLDLTPS